MNRIKQNGKENKGFTLIELIVAIAVLGILSVPLLNSFAFSGRVNHDSVVKQDANNVAQEVLEITKAVSSKAVLEAALSGMGALTVTPAAAPPEINGISVHDYMGGTYTIDMTGYTDKNFVVELVLTHNASKAEYVYNTADFIEVYDNTNVIFTELIAYDNGVLTAFENGEVNYENDMTLDFIHNITVDGGTWNPAYEPFLSYGDLIHIDEAGSDLLKSNISKSVDVNVYEVGSDIVAEFKAKYILTVDITGDTPPENEDDTSVEQRYVGTITYQPEKIKVTLSKDEAGKLLPLYIMFAEEADFNSVTYTVNNAVADTNLAGGVLDVYVVRQGADIAGNDYRFNVTGSSYEIYTNAEAIFETNFVSTNPNKTISYTDINTVYSIYDVMVTVKYRNEPIVTLNP